MGTPHRNYSFQASDHPPGFRAGSPGRLAIKDQNQGRFRRPLAAAICNMALKHMPSADALGSSLSNEVRFIVVAPKLTELRAKNKITCFFSFFFGKKKLWRFIEGATCVLPITNPDLRRKPRARACQRAKARLGRYKTQRATSPFVKRTYCPLAAV